MHCIHWCTIQHFVVPSTFLSGSMTLRAFNQIEPRPIVENMTPMCCAILAADGGCWRWLQVGIGHSGVSSLYQVGNGSPAGGCASSALLARNHRRATWFTVRRLPRLRRVHHHLRRTLARCQSKRYLSLGNSVSWRCFTAYIMLLSSDGGRLHGSVESVELGWSADLFSKPLIRQ